MQAYHLDSSGNMGGLVLRDTPIPEPGDYEVLVRVHARSLNFRDTLIMQGRYPLPAVSGVVPLSDGAGEVLAVGSKVKRFATGDKVAGSYFPQWQSGRLTMEQATEQYGCTRDGMLAEYVLANEQGLVRTPQHLSYAEAACLPCAALTAWSALNGPRRIIPGETVLTIGTGGVALFATQFARMAGARVIAITSSAGKAAVLKEHGAHEVVNYVEHPDWDRQVRILTAGRGMDHIIETGSIATLPKSINSAALDCQLTLIAALASSAKAGDALDPRIFAGLLNIRRVFVGSRNDFEEMNRALELHQLRPRIDKAFAWQEARLAYQHFESRQHIGKVVIVG
ncbi:MAG: NAD(P)-dependent alcohol dehydrogenase [Pseudomonadota bacterium]